MQDQGNQFPSAWVDLGAGVRRRVLSDSTEAMTAEVAFEKGAVGSPHSHPHLQSTYVAQGCFSFEIDGEIRQVAAGEALVIPRNAVHGCTALEAGVLIDTFMPRRDDFL